MSLQPCGHDKIGFVRNRFSPNLKKSFDCPEWNYKNQIEHLEVLIDLHVNEHLDLDITTTVSFSRHMTVADQGASKLASASS